MSERTNERSMSKGQEDLKETKKSARRVPPVHTARFQLYQMLYSNLDSYKKMQLLSLPMQ